MKAKAIVQARFGSSRLPGKVLLKIMGKSILEYVIERVGKASKIDAVIIATTLNKDDWNIVKLADRLKLDVYRGSENDVLDRYYQAAKIFKVKHIVRITADSPLIDCEVIDNVIGCYFKTNADYCSNTLVETFPDGQDVEVFRFDTLKLAWNESRLLSEREHVTPYIKKHPEKFKLVNFKCKEDLSSKRWTLDEKNDFDFIKAILESLYPINPYFNMNDVLNFLQNNPGLEDINKNIIRNEGYLKSLKKDRIVGNDCRE